MEEPAAEDELEGITFRPCKRGAIKRKRKEGSVEENEKNGRPPHGDKIQSMIETFHKRVATSFENMWKSWEGRVFAEMRGFLESKQRLAPLRIAVIVTPLEDRRVFVRRLYLKFLTLKRYDVIVSSNISALCREYGIRSVEDHTKNENEDTKDESDALTKPDLKDRVILFHKAESVKTADFSHFIHLLKSAQEKRISFVFVATDNAFKVPLSSHEIPDCRLLNISLPIPHDRLDTLLLSVVESLLVVEDGNPILFPTAGFLKIISELYLESSGSTQRVLFMIKYLIFWHYIGKRMSKRSENHEDAVPYLEVDDRMSSQCNALAKSYFEKCHALYRVIRMAVIGVPLRMELFQRLFSMILDDAEPQGQQPPASKADFLRDVIMGCPIMKFNELLQIIVGGDAGSSLFTDDEISRIESLDRSLLPAADRRRRAVVYRLLLDAMNRIESLFSASQKEDAEIMKLELDSDARSHVICEFSPKSFQIGKDIPLREPGAELEQDSHEIVFGILKAITTGDEDYTLNNFKLSSLLNVLADDTEIPSTEKWRIINHAISELVYSGVVRRVRGEEYRLNFTMKMPEKEIKRS